MFRCKLFSTLFLLATLIAGPVFAQRVFQVTIDNAGATPKFAINGQTQLSLEDPLPTDNVAPENAETSHRAFVRGHKYAFDLSAVDLTVHSLYLTTSNIGQEAQGGLTAEQGTVNFDSTNQILVFMPNENTPNLIYYQCRNHANIGGEIKVINLRQPKDDEMHKRMREALADHATLGDLVAGGDFTRAHLDAVINLDLSRRFDNSGISTEPATLVGLDGLKNLQDLTLDGNRLKDLAGLEHLTELATLRLNDIRVGENPIDAVQHLRKKLKDLPKLRHCEFRANEITSSGMEQIDLPNLEVIDLAENVIDVVNIHDGTSFRLPKLIHLDLRNNPVKNIDQLDNHPTLEVLNLSENLATVEDRPNPDELFANVTDIPNLRVLNLWNAKFKNIPGIAKFKDSLVEINLGENDIANASGEGGTTSDPLAQISTFTGLTRLDLSHNNIHDVKSVIDLAQAKLNAPPAAPSAIAQTGNPDLEVDVSGNPVSDSQIQTLETLGVVVVTTSALAVELSTFSGESSDEGITLKWRTESETNNVGFNVYRRIGDQDFMRISFVEGQGNSAVAHDYIFTDQTADIGETYSYFIEDIDLDGTLGRSKMITITFNPALMEEIIPIAFKLYQNYPNPFNPETWIPFDLPIDSAIEIEIYNSIGESVRLIDLGQLSAGQYVGREKAAYWNGKNDSGETVSSGTYFYQIRSENYTAVRKMVILK